MFIRSERLFLRPSWPDDWPEIHAAIADEGIVRNLSHAPWPYRIEDAMAFARRTQEHRLPRFVVTLPGDAGARLIGCIGLNRTDGDGDAELGYWIARDHWGQGYASEAARAVLRLATTLGHRRIVASHFVDNPASGRVLEKSGFAWTGEQARRFSEGRGEAAPVRNYVRDLAGDCTGGEGDLLRAA